jgi:hypothetical protein
MVALFLAVAQLVVFLYCRHTVGVQSDESVNIYGALRILDGDRIYRDFWVYHTPGIFFLTAAVFGVLGKLLFSIRAVLFLSAAVATATLYILGRKFLGAFLSLLAPVLFIMIGINFWCVAGYHWYGTLLLIFSTFFAARFVEDHSRRASLFASGVLAASTFLFQQPKGAYLICLMFPLLLADAALRTAEEARTTRIVRTGLVFVVGICTPLLVTVLYFTAVGTLKEAVSAAIVFPVRLLLESGGEEGFAEFYGALTMNELYRIVRDSSFLGIAWWAIRSVSVLIKYLVPLSLPLAIVLWIVRRVRESEENALPLLCAVAGVAAFASALQRPDFYHLLTILAPCYLALAYVLHCVIHCDGGKMLARVGRASGTGLTLIILIVSARMAVADLFYASRIETVALDSPLGFIPDLEGRNDSDDRRYALEAVIDYIQFNTTPEENIFVMSYTPFIYYLSGRHNVTKYVDIPSSPCGENVRFHVFKLGEASFNMKRLEEMVRALEADRTPIVILDSAAACQVREDYEEPATGSDPLIDYIRAHYRVEFDYDIYVIMIRSD